MKSVLVAMILSLATASYAKSMGDSYKYVKQASCANSQGESIILDINQQIFEAVLNDNGQMRTLSIDPLKTEHPDVQVELTFDFYSSGYDVLGSLVMDGETFGTVGILLEEELLTPDSQEMNVFFMEAMTGRQFSTQMTCEFKF